MQLFVRSRETILLEVVIATLLDHILQRNKAGFILIQAVLQRGNGFFDRGPIFARRALFRFRADEAVRKNGHHQFKRLFALGLLA
ncbi:MAG: hypothetical protein ACXVDN_21440 [Ktedonobacteraceae bacterium]